jgi:hypothetical protein
MVDGNASGDDLNHKITMKISMLEPERIPCGPMKDECKVHLLEDAPGAGALSIFSESAVPPPTSQTLHGVSLLAADARAANGVPRTVV